MFLHFDHNKVALPPILGGPAPQNHLAPTPPSESSSHGVKRKRVKDTKSASPKTFSFERAIERAAHNELNYAAKEENRIVTNERLKKFESRDHLMQALGLCFKENHVVDFAACYCTHDPGVAHKQRIQTITNEIWKTTGYRFTVKDHPRTKDGYKTRLWCSQDEAHKSKPSKISQAPRISSDGVILAKARYPCRSGLLISSRDDTQPGISYVVVRMHHYFAHEPYYDHTLPPEMTQSIWEKVQAPVNALGNITFPLVASAPPPLDPPKQGSLLPYATPPDISMEDEEDESDGSNSGTESDDSTQIIAQCSQEADRMMPISVVDLALPPPLQEPGASSPLTPEIYQQRMRKHIANIRDFCHGLEYQLQFNDYKLLEVLESEGSQFLKLVHGCLEMEGRLRTSQGWEGGSTTPTPM